MIVPGLTRESEWCPMNIRWVCRKSRILRLCKGVNRESCNFVIRFDEKFKFFTFGSPENTSECKIAMDNCDKSNYGRSCKPLNISFTKTLI